MIVARSSSLIRLQVAISGSVRKQPRHRPDAPSTVQTMTQLRDKVVGAYMDVLRMAV